MIKAVLFDMDGVIVNTEPLHRRAYFKMFEEVNIPVTPEYYDQFTGRSTMAICENLCEAFELKQLPNELIQIKRKHFKKLFDTEGLDLIPGVLDIIKEYHQNGLKLVLASSASMTNIERIFKRFDLDQYFVAKISGADLKASKPHPEIFIRASELAATPPSRCVVIEDSTNGMKAAKAAGIYCIGYQGPTSENQDYTIADKVISDFKEIPFQVVANLIKS